MALKKDPRFMTGTQPVYQDEEEERLSRPSTEEILRWRRMGRFKSALIYFFSPVLLASAIGALAYFTRPEAMPAHQQMRQIARDVQADRLREARAAGNTAANGDAGLVADAGVAAGP